ncbi:MAG: YicC family protein [Clostridia bacterium]|nr:YicC family protein [Clostridia bacterium]
MLKSMTAFGRARGTSGSGDKDITTELKSVNSRFMDLSVRLPRSYSFLEEKIKAYLTERGISRGKIEVSVSVDLLRQEDVEITLDEAVAASYIKALETLRDTFGLRDDISTMRVAQNKDIFIEKKAEDDLERDWDDVRRVLGEAVDMFLAAREREGANLRADLLGKVDSLRDMAKTVEKLSAADVENYTEKLEARIRQLLDKNDLSFDDSRILTEVGIFADRVAIDEELVRLGSHFKAFEEIIDAPEAAGRKLDFLVQEINREINTIGSKANNTEIAHLVVEMKTVVEKIREQIQNLE